MKRKDLLKLGVPRGRLERRDVQRVAHGIVLNPGAQSEDTVWGRCISLLPALTDGQFFSRRTALELYGLPATSTQLIEVGAMSPQRAPRRPEISGHRVRAYTVHIRDVNDLPVVAPADAWCMVAHLVPLHELVAIGDALLSGVWVNGRKQPPLASHEELVEAIERHRGTFGSQVRRDVLPLLRWPVDSPAESRIRMIMRDAGLPEPVVQCAVPTASRVYRADLGYPAAKIAIEYDGAYHFVGGVEQARRDVERWEAMTDAGWRVVRVTARDLRDPHRVIERLRRLIAEREPARA